MSEVYSLFDEYHYTPSDQNVINLSEQYDVIRENLVNLTEES